MPTAGTCSAQCTPYRSPDSCADDESFPLLIQRRTASFNTDPDAAHDAGHFIQHLEDKLKGFLFSSRHAKVRAPKIYYCTTSSELNMDGLENFDYAKYNDTGFVIRATNLHSNQGVLVFPNGLDEVEIINNIVMDMNDVVTYLVSLQATKVIIEEYIEGQDSSIVARRKLDDTQVTCTDCHDKLTTWMKKNNATCTTSPSNLASKCNKNPSWKEKKFCQLSCHQAGYPYDGDDCCGSEGNTVEQVSPGPCDEKWRCGNHAEENDPQGPRKYNVCHVNGGGHENTICVPETSAHLFPDKKTDNYCGFCDEPRIDDGGDAPEDDCSGLPTEYKVHVFNDQIGSINIVQDRGCDCACWAEVDAEWNRLDQHGCFTPSSEGQKVENGCTAIDFYTGREKAHPMKGLDICGTIEKLDDCVIQDIIDVAKKIG